jgi:hypothetical protein
MVFSYKSKDGNIIYIKEFINKFQKDDSDYSFYNELDDNDNDYKLQHYNLKQLLCNRFNYVYKLDVDERIRLTPDNFKLDFSANLINNNCIENIYESLCSKLTNNIIEIKQIEKYITVISPKELTEVNKIFFTDNKCNKTEIIKQIILDQKKFIKNVLEKTEFNVKIKWMIKNSSSQHTASFNPIIEDNKLWYGEYFKRVNF